MLLISPYQKSGTEEKSCPVEGRKIFTLGLSIFRRLKHGLCLLPIRFRNGGYHSLSGGVDDVNPLLALRINPFTLNEHLVTLRWSSDGSLCSHLPQAPSFNSPVSLRKTATVSRSSSVRP